MVNYQESFVWKLLLRTQKVVLLICNILMVIIIAAEVVLRYFFKADLLGYEEIIIILAMWLYFIGGSYASYTKSHINAEVVTLFLKIKLQKIIRLVASNITTFVSINVAFWVYEFFIGAL